MSEMAHDLGVHIKNHILYSSLVTRLYSRGEYASGTMLVLHTEAVWSEDGACPFKFSFLAIFCSIFQYYQLRKTCLELDFYVYIKDKLDCHDYSSLISKKIAPPPPQFYSGIVQ